MAKSVKSSNFKIISTAAARTSKNPALAENDTLLASFLRDPHYRVDRIKGIIYSQYSKQGHLDPTFDEIEIGFTERGYRKIRYCGKKLYVHRIIWLAFHGVINPLQKVIHKNGDLLDNRISNLDLVEQGVTLKRQYHQQQRVVTRGHSKIDFQLAQKIRSEHDKGTRAKDLAERYKLSKSSISGILSGITWKTEI
jgi:hypothetical protein